MIRARFKVESEDCRPVVWPNKHPYWCWYWFEGEGKPVGPHDSVEQARVGQFEAVDKEDDE